VQKCQVYHHHFEFYQKKLSLDQDGIGSLWKKKSQKEWESKIGDGNYKSLKISKDKLKMKEEGNQDAIYKRLSMIIMMKKRKKLEGQ